MSAVGRVCCAALLLIFAGSAAAQSGESGNLAEQQRASTVLGGTGLFNTFSTRTLYRGEFSFAAFWNRFNRDPGDLRIDQMPFNFTVGLTNRWELWVNWVTYQKVRSSNPPLLSGYQYNAVRLFGDPFDLLGPAVGGNDGAAFFPGTSALTGGILPTLGLFGDPIALGSSVLSPGGPNAPRVSGLGPAIISTRPNYFNDLPFYGVVDFLGFDSLGRPVLATRQKAGGSGDLYFGTKVNLRDANKHWFSLALGGYVKMPINEDDHARARGRTSGEYEYGPVLMLGQESSGKRVRLYENIGYIHTNDVDERGIKTLDLRDKFIANFGASFAIERHSEIVWELLHTRYVGGGTPSLQLNQPLDLNIGARFFFLDGAISFGGGYRRLLNSEGSTNVLVVDCSPVSDGLGVRPHGPPPPPPCVPREFRFGDGDSNGFVGFFSIGMRKKCPPPPVPSCVIETSSATLNRGDRLTLTVRPTALGYVESQLTYTYRWEVKDAQGRPVTVSGSGSSVQVSTTRLPCGSYSVTATVMVTAANVDHPEGCITTAQSSCETKFEITEPPCPAITCSIIASATQVTEGDRVSLRAQVIGGGSDVRYSWSSTGGRLSDSSGPEVVLYTDRISGPVTVRCSITTDRSRCDQPCPGASCSIPITVVPLPPPPQRPRAVMPCGPIVFIPGSARVTNEHKACLDQVALVMQQDPRSTLVIDGHRSSPELAGISLTRANNARDYLVNEKAIDQGRITVRNFSDTCPDMSGDERMNARVEFWVLPWGGRIEDVNDVKRCAAGSAPRVVVGEPAAKPVEPKPASRPRRAVRPGTSAELDDEGDEQHVEPVRPRTTQPRPEVRQVVEPVNPGRPANQAGATLRSATTLQRVRSQVSGGIVRIYIDTDGAAAYRDFTLSGPSRIVVDLSAVRNGVGYRTIPVAAGAVEKVRVGEPEAGTTRIVIDLSSQSGYRVARVGSSLVVSVGENRVAVKSDR